MTGLVFDKELILTSIGNTFNTIDSIQLTYENLYNTLNTPYNVFSSNQCHLTTDTTLTLTLDVGPADIYQLTDKAFSDQHILELSAIILGVKV